MTGQRSYPYQRVCQQSHKFPPSSDCVDIIRVTTAAQHVPEGRGLRLCVALEGDPGGEGCLNANAKAPLD